MCIHIIYIHTHVYIHVDIPTYLPTYLPTYVRTYIHTYRCTHRPELKLCSGTAPQLWCPVDGSSRLCLGSQLKSGGSELYHSINSKPCITVTFPKQVSGSPYVGLAPERVVELQVSRRGWKLYFRVKGY